MNALHIKAFKWDDKLLREDEITTPTDNEPFFDEHLDGVFLHEAELSALLAKYGGGSDQEPGAVEPSPEPCADDIPCHELVYWLGNAATGQVECPCESCAAARSQGTHLQSGDIHIFIPKSFYQRLRAKIPVIAIPRIEGIN